jgi:hypothetical protein
LPKTVKELYTLVDKCARVEKGRKLSREEDCVDIDSEDDDETISKKKNKKHNKKRKDKTVMTVEGSGMPSTGKKAKAEATGKEATTCADCREVAAAEKDRKSDGLYCKIHRTKGHDLQECHQVEQLVKRQKAEYEKHDKEKGQNGAGGKGWGGEANRPSKAPRKQGKPAKGREKEDCSNESDGGNEEETNEQEFQKATDALCIDGGASLHSSHRQLKQWAREVNAVEPTADSRKPLKWSRMPIIFDEEDHPDRITVIGCLPLLVSPTIRNLKVTKMLVDGEAGLNLISPKVISKLQIAEEELKVTGTFQGINPGRSHPKGKITDDPQVWGSIVALFDK